MSALAVARHNAILTLREPGPALSRIISPLVLMALLQPLYRSMFPGPAGAIKAAIMCLMLFSLLCVSLVANSLLNERIWHTLDRLRATPLRAGGLLAGKFATPLAVLLIQQLVVLVLATTAFGVRPRNVALLAGMGLTWAVMILCMGAALAAVTSTPSAVSAATDLASLACTALSGALVPLADLPGWVRHLAPASPAYWAVRGFDAAISGSAGSANSAGSVALSCAVLLGMALLAATVAARRLWR
jgi:ABC-2 type transport system permease protein